MSIYIFSAFVGPVIIILASVYKSLIQYFYLFKKKPVSVGFRLAVWWFFVCLLQPVGPIFTHFSHFYSNVTRSYDVLKAGIRLG